MRRIRLSDLAVRQRVRRWDVIVLGSALPGLVAAARLAMGSLRVLVIEEEAAARRPSSEREPFFLPAGGIVDACLRELTLPLIDRRRLEATPLAYQVVLPTARIDVGAPPRVAQELIAWGLAKPEAARTLVRGLAEAGAAERAALLEAPFVRAGSLRALVRGVGTTRAPRHARGLPVEAAHPTEALAAFFDAQVRALANTASPTASPEARARLLGAPFEGGLLFAAAGESLAALFERRLTALRVETRVVGERFELVGTPELAGIAPRHAGEFWLARALVLNAPAAPLARTLREGGAAVPEFLDPDAPGGRRVTLRLRAPPEVLPEGMARRVIHVAPAEEPGEPRVTTIALSPVSDGHAFEIRASASAADRARSAADAALERAVLDLMPFSATRLTRLPEAPAPRWDDESWLEEPGSGSGWPAEAELRLASHPPVYRLARPAVGMLGVEGELLLGWRGGDALRAELG